MKIKFFRIILAFVLSFTYLFSAILVLAANVDFTTWTENDVSDKITVSGTQVLWEDIRHNNTDYVAQAFSSENLSQNYTVDFTFVMDGSTSNAGQVAHWGVGSDLKAMYDVNSSNSTGIYIVSNYFSPSTYQMKMIAYYESGNEAINANISPNTYYYMRITYDSGASENGIITYQFWNEDYTIPGTSASIELNEANTYNYMFSMLSYKNPAYGNTNPHYGLTENMTISFLGTLPSVTTGNVTSIEYDPFFQNYTGNLGFYLDNDGASSTSITAYYEDISDPDNWHWVSSDGTTYTTGESGYVTVAGAFGFEVGHTYNYFIRATNSTGYTDGSTENFTVTQEFMAPIVGTLAYPIEVDVDALTATIYGEVINDGGDNVTGYFWYRAAGSDNYTLSENTTDLQSGNMYSANITGLSLDVYYEFFAEGINDYGTGSGSLANFQLRQLQAPTIVTLPATNIIHNRAYVSANVTDLGNDDVIQMWWQIRRYGTIPWIQISGFNVSNDPYYEHGPNELLTTPVFGLTSETQYEFRAVAYAWQLGSPIDYYGYGDVLTFRTFAGTSIPVMLTGDVEWLSQGYVRMIANVQYDGGSPVEVYTQYRQKGLSSWNETLPHTFGAVTGNDAWTYATTLENDKYYEYRSVGINEQGTGYGSIREFYLTSTTTTDPDLPTDDPTDPTLADVNDLFDQIRANMGLVGIMGTWAFMGLILLIIAVCFGAAMFTVEGIARTMIAVIWGLISIAVVGGFIFSGQLGIFPILILIGGVVLLILIVASMKLSGGTE